MSKGSRLHGRLERPLKAKKPDTKNSGAWRTTQAACSNALTKPVNEGMFGGVAKAVLKEVLPVGLVAVVAGVGVLGSFKAAMAQAVALKAPAGTEKKVDPRKLTDEQLNQAIKEKREALKRLQDRQRREDELERLDQKITVIRKKPSRETGRKLDARTSRDTSKKERSPKMHKPTPQQIQEQQRKDEVSRAQENYLPLEPHIVEWPLRGPVSPRGDFTLNVFGHARSFSRRDNPIVEGSYIRVTHGERGRATQVKIHIVYNDGTVQDAEKNTRINDFMGPPDILSMKVKSATPYEVVGANGRKTITKLVAELDGVREMSKTPFGRNFIQLFIDVDKEAARLIKESNSLQIQFGVRFTPG